jgi:NAD(P)-dependent dehydrogenase (short-subunit alcohol dehydrogenase family)
MELKDKVALVTGASKGIGKEIARALAGEGCHVALFARSESLLRDLAEEIERKHAVKALPLAGDIREESDIRKAVQETVGRLGPLSILVNNAGLGTFQPVADLTTEAWDRMFAVNVRGHFLFTRECIPSLRKSGLAFIVFVVSLAGKNAFVGGSGYAATKHAILGFSRCLMLEERKNGINTLAICPGSVDTDFPGERRAPDDPKRKTMLQPEDVAEAVLGALRQPDRAMVSEIDIRPSSPGA